MISNPQEIDDSCRKVWKDECGKVFCRDSVAERTLRKRQLHKDVSDKFKRI